MLIRIPSSLSGSFATPPLAFDIASSSTGAGEPILQEFRDPCEAAALEQRPLCSVIVPHFRDLENLDRCLSLLQEQTLDHDSFEVIVAENGPPDDIEAVVQCVAGRARLIVSFERGAGPARNAGAIASRGRMLAFIDSDCRPESDFLARGLEALAASDIVGGCIRVTVNDAESVTAAEAFELVFAFQNDKYIAKKKFSVSAALFVSRKIFYHVGPFRAGMSEDLEWCRRACRAGYSLGFASDAVVHHQARRSWDDIAKKWRRLTDESFAFIREQPFGLTAWLLRTYVLPLSIVPHLVTIFRSRKLHRMSERLGAAAMLCRLRLARFVWGHLVILSKL